MHRSFQHTLGLLPAATAVVALAACGGSDQAWQGTVIDSAGVQIVQNAGDGLWGPDDAWTVQEDLRIGTAEGEAEYQFGNIIGVDVGSDGRVYVLDQQAHEVRVFGPDGAFITAMGQAGSGPGELSQAAGPLFVSPNDTIVVPDMMQQRITLYTAAGEPAGSHPLPMAGGLAVRWMETPAGDLVQQAMIMSMPNQPQQVEQKNLLLRRSGTGEVLDTILEMPFGESMDFSGSAPRFTLFETEPVWTLGQDGHVYFGMNSTFDINEYNAAGDLVRTIRKPFERQPITEGDQEEFIRVLREIWEQQGVPPQALDQLAQQLQFADFYPAFANLLGGPEGTLWVQQVQSPEEARALGGTFNIQDLGSARWEVFDDQGRLLGTVQMPPRFSPLMFIDDAIYGVIRDDLDVQYVARYLVQGNEAMVGE